MGTSLQTLTKEEIAEIEQVCVLYLSRVLSFHQPIFQRMFHLSSYDVIAIQLRISFSSMNVLNRNQFNIVLLGANQKHSLLLQRKQRYRDRAAERRTLHKGIGIGPGQKYISERELEKQEADAATQMPAVLAKTAAARPIGRDNVGKRMLEGMGWKEVSKTCFSLLYYTFCVL